MAILDPETLPFVQAMDADERLAHGILPRPVVRRPAYARRVIIIGAGPGGVIAAVRLQQAGYDNITILEAGDGIGGTWRTNTYPGCACDVQAPLYSFSFAMKTDWTTPYAPQPEILAYVREVACAFGVDQRVRTHARVTALEWDDAARCWHVFLAGDERLSADIVITAIGLFGEPNQPDIPGLDRFSGQHWHSACWPQEAALAGKRVAVVGSGATAVQIVPAIAPVAAEVHAFIRSPQWLLPKAAVALPTFRSDTDVDAAAALVSIRGDLFQRLEQIITLSPAVLEAGSAAAAKWLEQVVDPDTRAALTPESRWGCYRTLVSDNFYPAFNQPHVRAIRQRIKAVEPEGIRTEDGALHPLDVIVFATGFRTTAFLSSIAVTGREGMVLANYWKDGARAQLGIAMPGFPNLFQLYGPNTNAGSIFFMIECQVDYIIRQLQAADAAAVPVIEVERTVAEAFESELAQAVARVSIWQSGCANYYTASSGRNVTQWPGSMTAYRARTL